MRPHAIRVSISISRARALLLIGRSSGFRCGRAPRSDRDAMAQAVSRKRSPSIAASCGISGSSSVRAEPQRPTEFDCREAAAAVTQAARRQAIALDDYVLTQPPVYSGAEAAGGSVADAVRAGRTRERKYIPVVADLLKATAEQFSSPGAAARQRDRIQARLCRAAAGGGVDTEQAVRVYSFETGGSGNHDIANRGCSASRRVRARSPPRSAQSAAHHHSVELIPSRAMNSSRRWPKKPRDCPGVSAAPWITRSRAEADGGTGAFGTDEWRSTRSSGYAAGLGHPCDGAGYRCRPLLQTTAAYFRDLRARQGLCRGLTAAELEMMNLTATAPARHGDDAAGDPRSGPDLEFLFSAAGYERNPVAIRNNTVAETVGGHDNRMDSNSNCRREDLAAAFRSSVLSLRPSEARAGTYSHRLFDFLQRAAATFRQTITAGGYGSGVRRDD